MGHAIKFSLICQGAGGGDALKKGGRGGPHNNGKARSGPAVVGGRIRIQGVRHVCALVTLISVSATINRKLGLHSGKNTRKRYRGGV
jgi:hypothetical protein